jgi:hypothetical protein
VVTGLFAALVSLGASRARRWTWLWISGIAFGAAGGAGVWVGIGLATFLFAVWTVVTERRTRVRGALVGGAAVQVLLHLPQDWFHGWTAILVAVAILPVLASGYRRAHRSERRLVRRVAAGTVVLVVLAAGAYAAAGALARPSLNAGVNEAQHALDLIEDGQTEQASEVLAQARSSFDEADSLLNGPLAAPARALPVIGHHARATGEMARAGAELSAVAARNTTSARYDDLALSAGHISLGHLAELQEPVAESRAALEVADQRLSDLDVDWLVPPVADPLAKLTTEVRDALDEAEMAEEAIKIAPPLLGLQSAQTYLVLLAQPAESRFGGGFVGTWAELTALSGQIDLTDSGSIDELRNAPGSRERELRGPLEYLRRYGRYFPAYNIQNITASPDFPTVENVAAQLYPQTGARPRIQGALYLDPIGVAALLELSGPVDVAGLPEPLDASNAAELLSTRIYELYPDSVQRDPVLNDAIDALFDALTARDLPGPRTVADALSPVVRGNHLAFSVTDPDAQAFLDDLGATGAFPDPVDGTDLLAIKTANAAPNKIDTYLSRDVQYEVHVNPATGDVDAKAFVTFVNEAPTTGLPAVVGTNRALIDGKRLAPQFGTAFTAVAVWTPFQMTEATSTGFPLPMEIQEEFGRQVYSAQISIPPGAVRVLEFQFRGRVTLPYRLVIDHQGLSRDGNVGVTLTTTEGWDPRDLVGFEQGDGGELVWEGTLTEDQTLQADFDR